MCVSKFVRMSNQLSSIAIIFFFNNAAFREDNFESLALFNFFFSSKLEFKTTCLI